MGLQDRSGRVRKISPPLGFDPPTVQPVATRYGLDGFVPAHIDHYTPERNRVCRVRSVAGLLYLQFILHALLCLMLCVLYSYINTSLLYLLSSLCRVFTIIYLQQTMFLQYVVLQLFCISFGANFIN